MTAKLADGSSIDVDIHTSTILWHGSEIKAEVIALEDRPLLGMMFLDGCRMNVDFVNGGLMELSEVN